MTSAALHNWSDESCCQSLEIECYDRAQQQLLETKGEQDKIEKRSEGTGSGGKIDSSIVCEILSRLPVKSLVRFKCVCKGWRFLTEEDSYFISLHLNQSKKRPNLLFIKKGERRFLFRQIGTTPMELVTVNLMLEGRGTTESTASLNTIMKMKIPYEDVDIFGPVNGLIGFYSSNSGICICNVSTQKVSPWIKSTLSRHTKDEEKRVPSYEMGFDPVTKKHKVICIWKILDSKAAFLYEMCQVLTVGDNKWRRVEFPPLKLKLERGQRRHTLYLNGFIYYCASKFMKAGEAGNDKIVAFDVGAEKFREIAVPDFILNQPKHVYRDGSICCSLIELEGRLALVSRMCDYTAKVWIFDDVQGNKVEEKNTRMSSSTNENWIEYPDIELPYLRSKDPYIFFHSVVGTNQIILESHDELYSYNWKTKSCKEIDISGLQYYPSESGVSTMVESLFHVQ